LPTPPFWNYCFARYGGEFDLDLASCLLIGDKLSNVAAGQAAGVEPTILLVPHIEGFANRRRSHVERLSNIAATSYRSLQ
jgi:histidinol phosphatase-like enzyme